MNPAGENLMKLLQHYAFSASLIALCAISVSACSTVEPRYAARPAMGLPGQPGAANSTGGAYKVGKPYQVRGQWYYPAEQPDYNETGIASWYGEAFNGKPTANGELFDMNVLSAAHKTLPLPSLVEVTNLDNGRAMQLRVNDRGPFVDDRIIDLSRAAAEELGVLWPGLARVRVRYVGPATIPGQGRVTVAQAPRPQAVAAAPAALAVIEPPRTSSITQTELPPLQEAIYAAAPQPEIQVATASAPAYQVQAGAFSDRANAERVATQLAEAGLVEIQPVDRGGATLYRVMVRDIAGESEAGLVRDKVVGIGLADARIITPF